MSPKVSLLIPVYNSENYLYQCLDSILSQSFDDIEVILLNDGSTDNSFFLCTNYASRDKRVRVYSQENMGVSAARNRLLSLAKGEYILFVDSDDWIEPDALSILYQLAISSCADIVGFQMVFNDSVVRINDSVTSWTQKDAIMNFLFHRDFNGSLCNKFFRASVFQGERFDNSIGYGEDAMMCWGILLKINHVLISQRQLYHYRMNTFSISHESFSSKKMSAVRVWTHIVRDTKCLYPQFLDIARGHFMVTCTMLLRNAAHCNYDYNHDIKLLQRIIKTNYVYSWRAPVASIRLRLYALIALVSYKLAAKF